MKEMAELPKLVKVAADHLVDFFPTENIFSPPIDRQGNREQNLYPV